jgi:aldose 1-epimerase
MPEDLTLSSSDLSVTMDLANSGRLSSVRWRDLEIAVSRRPNLLYWGWYAMAPWAGRIRNGELNTPHGAEKLPTHLLEPHAIHGLLFDAKINLGEKSDQATMVCGARPSIA